MKNAAEFWDKAARKYAKSSIADMESYTYTLDHTRSYLAADDNVLEVGCGTGSTALLLAGNVRQITASDISANMISIGSGKAQEQGISNVKFVTAGLFDSDIESGPYDVVLAFNMLHLLEDLPGAIQRINGLLKSDGLFISKTICGSGPGMPLKLRIMKLVLPIMQLIGKAPYVNFMKITALEETISAGGFKIIETGNYPASPPSRYVVARKV